MIDPQALITFRRDLEIRAKTNAEVIHNHAIELYQLSKFYLHRIYFISIFITIPSISPYFMLFIFRDYHVLFVILVILSACILTVVSSINWFICFYVIWAADHRLLTNGNLGFKELLYQWATLYKVYLPVLKILIKEYCYQAGKTILISCLFLWAVTTIMLLLLFGLRFLHPTAYGIAFIIACICGFLRVFYLQLSHSFLSIILLDTYFKKEPIDPHKIIHESEQLFSIIGFRLLFIYKQWMPVSFIDNNGSIYTYAYYRFFSYYAAEFLNRQDQTVQVSHPVLQTGL